MEFPFKLILTMGGMLFSLIVHEQMHARVAWWLGDPTGKNQNRFSWNPVHHLDPFQSVILPILLLIGSKGRFTFAGAKPCPIEPMNFRNPSLGMCLSAAAGPLSNYGLALIGFGVFVALHRILPRAVIADGALTPNGYFIGMFVLTNVLLGSFNLLPIPPLDGSRILRHFSPREVQDALDFFERFGLVLVIVLVYFGAAQVVLPVRALVFQAFYDATGLDMYEAGL